jgi:16S rRNA G527 N7-methylase RsmG
LIPKEPISPVNQLLEALQRVEIFIKQRPNNRNLLSRAHDILHRFTKYTEPILSDDRKLKFKKKEEYKQLDKIAELYKDAHFEAEYAKRTLTEYLEKEKEKEDLIQNMILKVEEQLNLV